LKVERETIRSVGIDVGTTTSHLVFSDIVLERNPFSPSRGFRIAERIVLHRGQILFTPLKNENTEIDLEKLVQMLREEYTKAGISPQDVETGAVVVTGESARKENAEWIVGQLATDAGKFVAASAGPNYEAVISAHGSGAVELSRREGMKLVHTDMGGGTSNIAVIENGEITSTACINVGARLVAFNEYSEIVKLEPAGDMALRSLGLQKKIGYSISTDEKKSVVKALGNSLINVLTGKPLEKLSSELMMTPLLPEGSTNNAKYSFSGGVAEYIYGYEDGFYGDLGNLLAIFIKRGCRKEGLVLVEPSERIRATVIGASSFTLRVSGITTYRSTSFKLPIRNLPVISPYVKRGNGSSSYIFKQVTDALKRTDTIQGETPIVLAFSNPVGMQYRELKSFTEGLASALRPQTQGNAPIILVFEKDIGNSVGNVLKRETGMKNVLSIDEVSLREGDFIDIGDPITEISIYPVVVKSLVFED